MVIIKFVDQSLLKSAFTSNSSGFNVEFSCPRQMELICASKTYDSDRLNNGSTIYIYIEQLDFPEIIIASTPVLYEQELETGSMKKNYMYTLSRFQPARCYNGHCSFNEYQFFKLLLSIDASDWCEVKWSKI